MEDEEREKLIDLLLPDALRTPDGTIICSICHTPQKQIASHLKKKHDQEIKEFCSTKEYLVYEEEIKKHLMKVRKRIEREIRKEKDPDGESEAERSRKYREKQLLMNPEEFKRKQRDKQREYLQRRSAMSKEKLREDQNRWYKRQAINSKTREAAIKRFRKDTMYGPIFPCVCCDMLFFRHQVVPYTKELKIGLLAKAKAKAKAYGEELKIDEEFLRKLEGCTINDAHPGSADEGTPQGPEADAERLEDEEQLLSSYLRWFSRIDRIIDNLADSRFLAQEMGLEGIRHSLEDCEDDLWHFRTKVNDGMERMQDNLLFKKDWNQEQERFGKRLSDSLDRMKKRQDWMGKASKKILNLLSEGKETGCAEEKEICNSVKTLVAERGRMADMAGRFAVSSIFTFL